MHNNIMAAGLRDHPPMLVTGRYAQWKSRFLRYIDTRPNGDALRICILEGPYTPTTVIIPDVPATDNTLAVPEQTVVETIFMKKSAENKCMSTRSSTRNLFPPLVDPERTIRRRNRVDLNLLNNFEEINMAANRAGNDGPTPAGGDGLPVPDLRTMEELCQPTLNGWGGPIAPIAI
ncbi:hypothetical protein Tco_1032011 [Tanacetum coccineum]|uniref:Integrase, catalytic region, zinc finger, CCHC-type, peptidase aspartic, catalytic n=1 Tax=Tanacetum coccineum TaxID=301880 RepID=A0ABQ5GAL6_9ASTR